MEIVYSTDTMKQKSDRIRKKTVIQSLHNRSVCLISTLCTVITDTGKILKKESPENSNANVKQLIACKHKNNNNYLLTQQRWSIKVA